MKTLTAILGAAAALLISANAFAADSITGTVRSYCMNGADSCHAYIDSTVGGVQKTTELNGTFSKIARYNGKIATVTGSWMCLNGGDSCHFLVTKVKKAAAQPLYHPIPLIPGYQGGSPVPGAADTKYGVVHTYCMNGAATCRAILSSNGKDYVLGGEFSDFAKFNGKIVEVTGNERCMNGADTCRFVVDSIKKVAAMPLTASEGEGNNVGLTDNTTGAVAGVSASGSSMGGAGVKH